MIICLSSYLISANETSLRAQKYKLKVSKSDESEIEKIDESIQEHEALLSNLNISDSKHTMKILGIECTSAFCSSVISIVVTYFGIIYNSAHVSPNSLIDT